MELQRNEFKHAIAAGKLQIGLWNSLCSNIVTEIVCYSGFDWLLLDTEHSPNELPAVMAQLQSVQRGTATPIVRPAWNDTVLIKRILDAGAQTLLIPYVQSRAEAEAAVAAMRYAPAGMRGFAGITRATRFGTVENYATRAHEELCLLVQIESKAGLDEIEAIAAVDGVDGLFIGPADLAASMGHPGNAGHPDVVAAIEDAIARIRKAGKPAGILSLDPVFVRRCMALGTVFTAVDVDIAILLRNATRIAEEFKAL